jgi:cell division protein DivIC
MERGARLVRRLALTLAVALLVGYIGLAYLNLWLIGQGLREDAARLRHEIAQLEAESRRLGAELAYYNTDAGIEELAREQLGLARPGETLVLFVREPDRSARR